MNKVEWSFNIELNCSDKIVDWKCSSHKLRENKVNEKFMLFELDEEKIPEKDLEFTFERENPHEPLCTVADECACLTFFVPESAKSNYEKYRGEYIFVLDRSGSMWGKRIEQAKKALILFLKSLPEDSKYNIISFGSKFERHYQESLLYTDENIEETINMIETFNADFGGT